MASAVTKTYRAKSFPTEERDLSHLAPRVQTREDAGDVRCAFTVVERDLSHLVPRVQTREDAGEEPDGLLPPGAAVAPTLRGKLTRETWNAPKLAPDSFTVIEANAFVGRRATALFTLSPWVKTGTTGKVAGFNLVGDSLVLHIVWEAGDEDWLGRKRFLATIEVS